MTLVRRISTVRCDNCGNLADLSHDVDLECDAGYPYNKARDEAGWLELYKQERGYIDLCPKCVIRGDVR